MHSDRGTDPQVAEPAARAGGGVRAAAGGSHQPAQHRVGDRPEDPGHLQLPPARQHRPPALERRVALPRGPERLLGPGPRVHPARGEGAAGPAVRREQERGHARIAGQRQAALLHLRAVHARHEAADEGTPSHREGLRLADRRDREPLPQGAGQPRRGVRHRGGAVHRRAGHANDAEHLPLRWRVRQERDAGRAASGGDHQRGGEHQHAHHDAASAQGPA